MKDQQEPSMHLNFSLYNPKPQVVSTQEGAVSAQVRAPSAGRKVT